MVRINFQNMFCTQDICRTFTCMTKAYILKFNKSILKTVVIEKQVPLVVPYYVLLKCVI